MSRGREAALVVGAAVVLAVALTWPLAAHLGSVGRVDQADGQFSIWNVAWVARTLVVDPRHVFDANIFYPHRWTLAYSENNLGAGALAVPVYWASHQNPYAAHNFVVLLGFVLSAAGMYYLARRLTGSRAGAAVAAIGFAFCPYVFAHTPHIQLLMTAGLPWAMLAFHRAVDRPSATRGAVLGLAMAAEAICCGYYGIFLILMVGYGVLVIAVARRWWGQTRFWMTIGVAALVAIAVVAPIFIPYLRLQRVDGFARPLDDARRYSADWQAYLASSSYLHAKWLGALGHWNEVLFPGILTAVFGLVGAGVTWGRNRREEFWLYGGLAVLALWASFGPAGKLYTALYRAIPLFTWLRAPARFGLVVVFALAVLAAYGVAAFLSRTRRPALVGGVLVIAAACELAVPLEMPPAMPLSPAYRVLAAAPRGPVIEMPFYYPQVGLFQHTKYMLASTTHWFPLVNGYSDYIPPDFYDHVMTLAPFPSGDAFRILEPDHVRYAMFHMYGYNDENRRDVLARLKEFAPYLRPLYVDDETRLYEIVAYPPHR